MNFTQSLKVADKIFADYKQDHPRWWRKIDGTPIINDLSVRIAEAIRDVTNEERERLLVNNIGLGVSFPVEVKEHKTFEEPHVPLDNSDLIALLQDATERTKLTLPTEVPIKTNKSPIVALLAFLVMVIVIVIVWVLPMFIHLH